MRKYLGKKTIILLIIVLLYFICPYFYKNQLLLKNIEYLPISKVSEKEIEKAIFYIDKNVNIKIEELKKRYKYCNNVAIIRDKKHLLSGSMNPTYVYKIKQIFFYSRIQNDAYAGVESMSNEVHYFWLPWGWYKIKVQITAIA